MKFFYLLSILVLLVSNVNGLTGRAHLPNHKHHKSFFTKAKKAAKSLLPKHKHHHKQHRQKDIPLEIPQFRNDAPQKEEQQHNNVPMKATPLNVNTPQNKAPQNTAPHKVDASPKVTAPPKVTDTDKKPIEIVKTTAGPQDKGVSRKPSAEIVTKDVPHVDKPEVKDTVQNAIDPRCTFENIKKYVVSLEHNSHRLALFSGTYYTHQIFKQNLKILFIDN